jgi:hypothetical protein
MRVRLYTITWNDRVMLPNFLHHYGGWVDEIIVFDDHSDDGTRELLSSHPKVEVRDLPAKGESFVDTALSLWNNAWKESRDQTDWVVLTNVDEFFVHPTGERAHLENLQRAHCTVVHPRGFEMYGDAFPADDTSILDALPLGAPMYGQDKMQVFNPNAISEMRYTPGRHTARPQGRVTINQDLGAEILHYKYVDAKGYTIPRQHALRDRMLQGDISKGYGVQYRLNEAEIMASCEWLKRHVMPVPSATHRAAH